MPDDIATFDLPSVMRTEDCISLHEFLCENSERTVVLGGAAVERFSGQAAQVIIAHQRFRQTAAPAITISDPSAALRNALTLLALNEVLGEAA